MGADPGAMHGFARKAAFQLSATATQTRGNAKAGPGHSGVAVASTARSRVHRAGPGLGAPEGPRCRVGTRLSELHQMECLACAKRSVAVARNVAPSLHEW